MKIIVIEDEVKTRNGIVNLIDKINTDYKVIGEAGNACDGMKLVKELKPDLIITDIKMAGIDGLEMLKCLKEQMSSFKTIILSGYAEFEFAKTAIQLGVQEYLLKPITVDHLANSLKNIETLIENEKKSHHGHILNLASKEHVLKEILVGNIKVDDQITGLFKETFRDANNSYPKCFLIKLSGSIDCQSEEIQQTVQEYLNRLNISGHIITNLSMYNEIVIVIPKQEIYIDLENHFHILLKSLHVKYSKNIVIGWTTVCDISLICSNMAALRENLKWTIVLGEEVIISNAKINNLNSKKGPYPDLLEKKIVSALYSNNIEKIKKYSEEFMQLWKQDFFLPSFVIESFICFMTSITNAIKEVNYELYKQINQKEILNKVIVAVTQDNINNALMELIGKITVNCEHDLQYKPIVMKALNIIKERYKDGITLEETAKELHITPEYLSTLFYKEKGQNFNSFLKEFRIKKAKELIVTTNMKVYEIALITGYSSPKYFCRVFKEITGLSPGEYAKMHKK